MICSPILMKVKFMPNRTRSVPIVFWVTEEEKKLIRQKMELIGMINMSAYLRKMAMDGYIIHLDFPELKEMVSLLRYSSNNLNQLTRRVHETGRIYETDLNEIKERQEKIWDGVAHLISRLSAL